MPTNIGHHRRGVIAVVFENERFLAIRRSEFVRAPRQICFPGGGIEQGESEQEALVREMKEELDADVEAVKRIWRSFAPSGVELFWWKTNLLPGRLRANPMEVEAIHWFTRQQLLANSTILQSNSDFLEAYSQGLFQL